jgi:DNA-binding NarL/FixJ family response regulator
VPLARAAELARLERAAVSAAAGRAATFGVVGAVGLGKTALLDALRDHAAEQGFVVLATQGRAADVELGFSSLLTMLRPLDADLDELAGDLAGELRAALALGQRPADPVAVRLATFRVLAAAAARRPLVLAIDDAHLLDRASADVLTFAVGRFCADAVLTVATSEPEESTVFDDLVTETITLEPLDPATLAGIVTSTVPLAGDPLRRCIELAEGNPLAAIELAGSLTPAQRTGAEPVPVIPRPTGVLARAFSHRLEPLTPTARAALAAVAADDTGELAVVGAALGRLGETGGGLAEAEAAGLLQIDGQHLRFTHPLLRPVAYHLVGVSSRRAAHRALAASLDAPHQGASRAWQLAAAADQPDETAAAALELVAGDSARRGGPASAARTLEWAASLTPDPARRRDRLVGAARAWLDAADGDAAARVAELLADEPPTAEAVAVVAGILRATRGPAAAVAYAHTAITKVEPPERRRVGVVVAEELLEAGALDDAILAATSLSRSPDPVVAAGARAVLALAGAEPAGELPEGDTTVVGERASALAVTATVDAGKPVDVLATLPLPTLGVGGARLAAGIERARAMASHGEVIVAHEELQRLDALVSDRAGMLRAPLELAQAEMDLLVGRHDEGRERAAAVRDHARRLGLVAVQDRATWILGRLRLATGDYPTAFDLLARSWRTAPHVRLADLAVAAAQLGRTDELEAAAAGVARLVGHADPAVDIRARRVLLSAGDADQTGPALARADEARLPLEAAEVLIAAAEQAARTDDRDAARTHARDAARRLAGLGICGWKARLEPVHQATAAPSVAAKLSPAEHRVALAVAEGRTNQEAAEALFLSTKTVDFHLQSIYRKLAIRSRTELAVLVHRDQAAFDLREAAAQVVAS